MRSAYSASVCTMQTRKHHSDSLPLVACERYIPTIKVKVCYVSIMCLPSKNVYITQPSIALFPGSTARDGKVGGAWE